MSTLIDRLYESLTQRHDFFNIDLTLPDLPKDRHVFKVDPLLYSPPTYQKIDLDQARKIPLKAMQDYFADPAPDYVLLIKGAAGLGKLWAGTRFAEQVYTQTGQRILYCGQRHAFYSDVMTAVAEQGLDASLWHEWLPRQAHAEPERETCIEITGMNTWITKGYDAIKYCIGVCGASGHMKNHCGYHKQTRQAAPLVFGQHEHVVSGHPLAEKFAAVIGDECNMKTFLRIVTVPAKFVDCDPDFSQVLHDGFAKLRSLAVDKAEITGKALYDVFGGARVLLDACTMAHMGAVTAPDVRSADDARAAPYNFLAMFLEFIVKECEWEIAGKPHLTRVYLTGDGLQMVARNNVAENMPKRMIWFDATGEQEIYELMFDCPVKIIEINPKPLGRIYQITDRANFRTSMKEKQSHVDQAKIAVDHLRRRYGDVVGITFLPNKNEVAGDRSMHFYANRGSNAAQDCGALIVVGAPQIPPDQLALLATALDSERMEPFDESWMDEERVYKHLDKNGDAWACAVPTPREALLRTILWQCREAEIIQAANRSRMLGREVDVYLMTNIPIDELPPYELITLRDLIGMPKGETVYTWSALQALCDQLELANGSVSVSALALALGVDKVAAEKQMDILLASGDWEKSIVRTSRVSPERFLHRRLN